MRCLPLIFLIFPIYLGAQITISGKISDSKGNPIPLANVYLKNIFDGGSTDVEGYFTFNTNTKGFAILIVSSTGYEKLEKKVEIINEDIYVELTLKTGNNLSEVIISIGAFEASDEKKATILKPLDIVTNPAASGDLYGALQTLPGVTIVGEETGLFVRGGDASETKTIIDGTLIAKPFNADVPNIPARGRFDPFLFKGTLFSTGGYSAQYGQALSSVLILETNDLPNNNEYSLGLNMAGLSGSYTKVWKEKTALLASAGYTDLSTLFSLVPQNRKWIKPPNGFTGTLGFRHKTNKDGMFKSYLQYQVGSIALNIDSNENTLMESPFENKNKNLFWNNSYKGFIGNNWRLFVAASISYDDDTDQLENNKFGSKQLLGQSRITLSRKIGSFNLRFGNETHFSQDDNYFNQFTSKINNKLTAIYAETEFKLSEKIAWRVGARSEYVSIIDVLNLAPRISFAYKLGINSMFSLAYGQFYQTPEQEFLRQSTVLNYEQAAHYIANYQWQTKQRIFRIEAYFKDYNNLVLTEQNNTINNKGFGFSKGIDIFWRDQKTIPNLTYWLSYSLVDAKRFYRNFTSQITPNFVSKHTLNVVANYKITPLTRLGVAYTFASGRLFQNPNNLNSLAEKTIDYHNINFSGSYLTSLFGNFTVIYVSLRNPFGIKQVFGYRYSDDGTIRNPIIPSSDWSFFAGISVSIRK